MGVWRVPLLCLFSLMLASCGGGGGPSAPVLQTLSISPSSPSVAAGLTTTLSLTGRNSDGSASTALSGATWTSSQTSVATVNANGTVTGVAVGSATITAMVGSVTTSVTLAVTVRGTVEGLASGASVTLKNGSESLVVRANGAFVFQTAQLVNGRYTIGVTDVSAGQACAVTDGADLSSAGTFKPVRIKCAAVASSAAYMPVAQGLPDLEPIYAKFCVPPANGRSLQHVVPVDLNKDGLTDFVLNLWCSPVAVAGTDHSGPTPTRIVALVQDAQGNFTDQTAEIFGSAQVEIGGVGEYYVTGDFNGDGYTDIVYSLNREDGRRINNPPTTQYVKNVALMSQGGGRYTAVPIGAEAWGAGFVTMDNASGGKDFIAMSFSDSPRAWTYSNNAWAAVPGFSWVGGSGSLFFSRSSPGTGSSRAINTILNSTVGVELYTNTSGTWTKKGEFGYPNSIIQKLCCNNAQPSGANFTQIDGKDLIDPSFGFSCEFRRTPTSAPEALVAFDANEIVGGYQGQVVVYGTTPLKEWFKLFSFGVGAGEVLQRNDLVIRNEVTSSVTANRMACMDLNGDGYDDIILYSTNFAGQNNPIVYLNDKTGAFDRVDPKVFPAAPSDWYLRNYVMADATGDGIREMIYFQIVGNAGSENRVQVHKGLRALGAADVLK